MKKSGKICMLDGDSEVRQLFADWCGLRNYELLATDNLFQFLRYSKEMQPDLFVLDLDMKDVSGWEVAGMLASDEGLKEIPIVMLMLSEQQDLSGRYGVAHYLPLFPWLPIPTDNALRRGALSVGIGNHGKSGGNYRGLLCRA